MFIELLKNTQNHLQLETPYFILKNEGYEELIRLLNDKGHLTLLTNGLYSTDVGLVQASFMDRVLEPIRLGAHIYIYGGSYPSYPVISTQATQTVWGIHSKTSVFDQKHTLIGTFNLDPRSENYNHELAFVCLENPELAQFVSQSIQNRVRKAGQLGPDGQLLDDRYPYMKASPMIKAGLFLFAPLIQHFDEFL
jgi:putative cardiolipin synthase